MSNQFLLIGKVAAVTLLLIILGACDPVTSLHPIYTKTNTVLEPDLVGVWNDDGETWQFERKQDHYTLTYTSKRGLSGEICAATYEAYLVRIGGVLFLDLFPDGDVGIKESYDGSFAPLHLFARVRLDHDRLLIALMNTDAIKKEIEAEQKYAHAALRKGDSDPRIILTGGTAELQQFLARYANEDLAWSEESELVRPYDSKAIDEKGTKAVRPGAFRYCGEETA